MATTIIPHIKLETETFPNGELDVIRLEGKERISQLFQYEILAVCRDPSGVEPEELCGQEAALVYARDGQEVRRVYGMLATVSDRLETETAYSTYRLVFVPRAYRLTLVETLDVFLDITVPDVIRQKMKDAGFREKGPKDDAPAGGSAALPLGSVPDGYDFELRLYDTYPVRDIVVQYQETDLAFVARLAEHLGISYFFEHQSGRDVVVFTDMNEGFRAVEGTGTLPFHGRGEHTGVFSFEETIRMIPAQYVVRDYNYRTPQVTLTGQAQVPTGLGSVVEYGAHVKTPDEAEKLAHVRAQERMAQRRVYEGKSDVPELCAGARMTLEGHPRGDTKLLLTEVTVRAEQVTLGVAAVKEAFFHADFKAISESRRFRPQRLTPKPRIHGVVNGVIDSPKDDTRYADVDDQGRYRVRFLFDTTSPGKGQASKLVRMAQPHAGEGYGMHFPLRPGVEVIITFVDGDPDRPIIAATVPNPQTASPVQAGNAPRNIIRTGVGNEINFDDSHESARIKMTVPHKSTVFQLGAPNSPERGAMLETQGAWSSVATSGIASATSFGAAFSAVSHFLSSGRISTIAELPKFAEGVATVGEVIASLLETASAGIEAAQAAREAHVNQLKADSIKAQIAARDQAKKTEAAVDDACSGEVPTALSGMDDYAAAAAAIRARYPKTADGKDPPGYADAMAALLKKPGMQAAADATAFDALPKGADGKVDKTSSAYQTWVAAQVAKYGSPAAANTHVDALQSTVDLHADATTKIAAYNARFPAGSTFPATESAYADAYRAAHPSSTLTDEQITALYEQDKEARAYAELTEKVKSYKEAQEAYQGGVSSLRNNQEFLRDSVTSGEYVGRTTYEVEGYEKAIDQNKKDLYGDPTASPPDYGMQGKLDTARSGLAPTVGPDGKPVPGTVGVEDLPASLGPALTDYQTSLAGVTAANQLDDTTWQAADAKKKQYDQEQEDLENGDSSLDLKQAKFAVDRAKEGDVILFSVLAGAIALAEDTYHRYTKAKVDPTKFWENIKASYSRTVTEFIEEHSTFKKNLVKHTIGSEFNTEVYAEHELLLKGDDALKLQSEKGDIRTSAKTTLGLHAEGKAELSSGGDIQINCDDGKLDVTAKTGSVDAKEGLVLASSKAGVEIKASANNLDLYTTKILKGAADEDVVLTAAKKASLLSQGWGLSIDGDGKSVTVGSKDWQLAVTDGKVSLGSAGDAAHLQLAAGSAKLQTTGTLTLVGKPVTFTANTVDFGKATIVSDSLLVKGSLDPALASIASLIKSAQISASAAQKASALAAQTDQRLKAKLESAAQKARQAAKSAERSLSEATATLATVKDVGEG